MNRYCIALIAWILLVSYLSLANIEAPDKASLSIPGLDKVIHFLFYFIMSILGLKVFGDKRWLWALCLAIFWGILMEFCQKQITSVRNFDFFDIIANIIGSITGILLYFKFRK